MKEIKHKTFWKRPEGKTGIMVLAGAALGIGYVLLTFIETIAAWAQNGASLAGMLMALAVILFMAWDGKTRALFGYMFKSVMRWITGLFVQIDPIGILKSYVDDLKGNLRKMNKQISMLRGQMHKLNEIIHNNKKQIKTNLELANKAKVAKNQGVMILKTRKAGRLRESNMKLDDLYKKMEVLYRVLSKMYENSQILMEDIKDQVEVKDQERKAIHASHNAMNAARSIISGDPDKRAMFDQAMEAITDDVAGKMGEMERFMDMSSNFMNSVDLQNGVFEEEGLKMLEKWEQEGVSLILGDDKLNLLDQANDEMDVLDLNAPIKETIREAGHSNQYDSFFD